MALDGPRNSIIFDQFPGEAMKVSQCLRLSNITIAVLLLFASAVLASDDWNGRLQHGIDLHTANLGCDSALASIRGVLAEAEGFVPPDTIAVIKACRELRNVFQSRGELDSVQYYNARTYSLLMKINPGRLEAAQNYCLEEARRLLGLGDKSRAKYFFNRAVAESLVIPPGATGDPRWACHNWGEYNYTIMKYQIAERFFLRAINEAVKMTGEFDWVTDEMVSRLGNFYNELGRYPEALKLQWRDLKIRQHIYGEHSIKSAGCLNNIAIVYKQQDMLDSAEALLREALFMCTASGDTSSMTTMTILGNLAETLENQSRYAEAEFLYLKVLENRKYNPNRSLTALAESELANFYCRIGRYREATALLEDALAIRRSLPTLQEHVIGTNCADLARIYLEQANYVAAERLLREAILMHRRGLGPAHPELADDLLPLGELLIAQGRIVEAEEVLSEALGVLKRIYDGPHTMIADVEADLALCSLEQGNKALAADRINQSLAISKRVLGINSRGYAEALAKLAKLQISMGQLEEASRFADQCLHIRTSLLPKDDPDLATTIALQAEIDLRAARFDRAEKRYREAISFFESFYGGSHPRLAESCEGLSLTLRASGSTPEAIAFAVKATEYRLTLFRQNAQSLSERSALAYVRDLRTSCDILLSTYFAAQAPTYKQRSDVAALILQSKFLVTERLENRDSINTSDPTMLRLRNDLRSTRFKLAQLFVQGPRNTAINSYRRSLDSLSKSAEQLAEQLSLHSNDQGDSASFSLASLVRSIPESTLAIEFVKFSSAYSIVQVPLDHYAALSLNRSGLLRVIDLGSAAVLNELVAAYQAHMGQVSSQGFATESDTSTFCAISRSLSQYLLSPLSIDVRNSADLLIAPDGEVASIAFSTLLLDGQFLVEHHDIRYLNAVRELLQSSPRVPTNSGILAIGDPDFDSPPEALQVTCVGTNSVLPNANYRVRSNLSSCAAFDSLALSRLSASGREADTIAELWHRFTSEDSRVLKGANATEEAFKDLAPGFNCVHLASHGFTVTPTCNDVSKRMGSLATYQDPLLLSGIYLAGANKALDRADSGLEDGILTASEIAVLNLSEVNTVVLSSCESGRGSLHDGEGVFGLMRAFRIAGVRTVVGTLWNIPDLQTFDLMSKLYTSCDVNIGDRISQIQRNIIMLARSRGRIDHPYTWGGFIAVGAQ